MNAKQENKFGMYINVRSTIDNHGEAWKHLTGFETVYNTYKGVLADIQELHQVQSSGTSDGTVKKAEAKALLIETALKISGILMTYGKVTGDEAMAERMNFNRTDLNVLRPSGLEAACRNILEEVLGIVPGIIPPDQDVRNPLESYGLTATMVATFQAQTDTYQTIGELPRHLTTARAAATAEMEERFNLADEILETQLDKLMLQFKSSNPVFFNDYQAARVMVDSGNGGNGLRGTVADATTTQTLEGALVRFAELGITRVTDSAGHYTFRRIPQGIYTLEVSLPGYTTARIERVVIKDTLADLDIRLTKERLSNAA